MAEGSQPGRSAVVRIWFVMSREYTTDSVLIQIQSERQVDLLGDARATVSRITSFHLNDGSNDFSGWPFWAWLLAATRRLEQAILSFLQRIVEREQGRRLDDDR